MLEKIISFVMLLIVLVYPLKNTSSNADIPQEPNASEILSDELSSETPDISSQNPSSNSNGIGGNIDPYSFIPSNTNNVTIYEASETSFGISYLYEGSLEGLHYF